MNYKENSDSYSSDEFNDNFINNDNEKLICYEEEEETKKEDEKQNNQRYYEWEILKPNENKTNLLNDQINKIDYKEKEIRIKNLPENFPNVPEIKDVFNLYFQEDFWEEITNLTNLHLKYFIEDCQQKKIDLKYLKLNKKTIRYPFTVKILKKFHGIILWIIILSNRRINNNWSHNFFLHTNFRYIMAGEDFSLIKKYFIIFNRAINNNIDNVNKIRYVRDYLLDKYKKYYEPGRDIVVDETLIKFGGRFKYSQLMVDKPARRGIKCYLVCDSHNFYCYNLIIYLGPKSMNEIFDSFQNKYNEKKNFIRVELITLYLIHNYLNQYKILYVDNYYTTINLSKFLIINKTGIVATIRENRIRVNKKQFSEIYPKNKGDVLFLINKEKNLTLTIFYDTILVYLISSIEVPKLMAPRINSYYKVIHSKPNCIHKYNKGSQGVDHCNGLTSIYRYNHPVQKWWKVIYYYLLVLSLCNINVFHSSIIKFIKNNKKNKGHSVRTKITNVFLNVITELIDSNDVIKNYGKCICPHCHKSFKYDMMMRNLEPNYIINDDDLEYDNMLLNFKKNKNYYHKKKKLNKITMKKKQIFKINKNINQEKVNKKFYNVELFDI